MSLKNFSNNLICRLYWATADAMFASEEKGSSLHERSLAEIHKRVGIIQGAAFLEKNRPDWSLPPHASTRALERAFEET